MISSHEKVYKSFLVLGYAIKVRINGYSRWVVDKRYL